MTKKFGIPEDVLNKIKARDKTCVYCHKVFNRASDWHGDWATIEHFREDGPFYWKEGLKEEDLAICCWSCNSSRGKKELLNWFKIPYCIKNNINKRRVAEPVKKYICTKRSLKIFSINQVSVQLKQIIEDLQWIFAKTMSEIPHYYIVRDDLSENDKKMFDEFEWFIKKNGYTAKFYSKEYTYFNIGNYKYWVIGNILNRAIVEEKR